MAWLDAASGALLVTTMLIMIVFEWTGGPVLITVAAATTTAAVTLMALRVGRSRQLYVLIGFALLAPAVTVVPAWQDAITAALGTASFIAAFFTALMSIRSVAATSERIAECGQFLAQQPPGRRYLALTAGGHLFGLVLSYGAISLLGSLATVSAAREPDAEIRRHRTRRMLIAIQRGFVSTLPWSPLAFAVAISTTVVPGATWADAVGPCLVSALILAGTGWALDTIFKPRIAAKPQPATAESGWVLALAPLLLLLAFLLASVAAVRASAEIRIVGAVMTVVPLVALVWAGLQEAQAISAPAALARRTADYALRELPGLRPELVLLMMAGFIGTLGGKIGAAMLPASGLGLAALPAWAILVGIFWLIPLAGQLGMNPILAVSLTAPLLPAPEAIGVSPTAMIVAMTGGWALSGATSPFTASTLLIGSLGRVAATHVGFRWNGSYALTSGTLLSLWVIIVAAW